MNVTLNIQQIHRHTASTTYDVVIVGAGPYGLSAAAHIRGKGLKMAIFGKPLSLWRNNMPQGMLLRSYWWATNLSDMLHPSLLSNIATYHDAPILNNRFESSVSGLCFIGISSVSSCGPFYRFVVGADAAARRIASAVGQHIAIK